MVEAMIIAIVVCIACIAIAIASKMPIFYIPSFILSLYLTFMVETQDVLIKVGLGVFSSVILFAFAFSLR